MLPDRVSNPGPRTYESGALPIALRGPSDKVLNLDGSCLFDEIRNIKNKQYYHYTLAYS